MQEISIIAESMLINAQQRLRTAASNMANVQTPGFKQLVSIARADPASNSVLSAPTGETHTQYGPGQMSETGRALDLAVSGDGFFAVRNGSEIVLTRAGRFDRGADGEVLTSQGHVLQTDGGGDLRIGAGEVEILESGLLLEDGIPVGRIRVDQVADVSKLVSLGGGLFEVPDDLPAGPANAPRIQQGMLEGSNVNWSAEMTSLMALQRQMEAGAQLVRTYDSLLGQAASRFATGGRR